MEATLKVRINPTRVKITYTQSGKAVAKYGYPLRHKGEDKSTWINLTFWEDQAETVYNYQEETKDYIVIECEGYFTADAYGLGFTAKTLKRLADYPTDTNHGTKQVANSRNAGKVSAAVVADDTDIPF